MDRPPGSGAPGLQVVSVQVKLKKIFFFFKLQVNLYNKICIFFNIIHIFEEKICIFCFISWFLTLKKNFFFSFLPEQRPPGGLELRNLEAYPKNLKSGGNSSYKNDFIPNNLSSQSKDKAYTPGLRKCVRTSPPP